MGSSCESVRIKVPLLTLIGQTENLMTILIICEECFYSACKKYIFGLINHTVLLKYDFMCINITQDTSSSVSLFLCHLFTGFQFFEASAKDNINVKQVFERLVDIICDKMNESLDGDPSMLTNHKGPSLQDTPPDGQSGCGC